ncbi:hypothetical protein ACTIVE_0770 [Actinomadura verrucosospora]|uniref:CHAT domain-containing protein n=2 Tax=Actinomadura verrucosospora TaxID=46165 RepID=A0A7D3VRR7_ACTVE|nr:hypothetical protein ACTIVE_0770 [Actinomadura verrucosospora]
MWGYLRRYVAPDRRAAREAEIVAWVGAWIGEHALGPVGPALVAAAPAVVRVVAPTAPEAAWQVLFLPWELAVVEGRPIALQDVTLVMQLGADRVRDEPAERDGPLRVLALFSLPEGGRVLNLRRERRALTRLLSEAPVADQAVHLRTLQYGVTRQGLREVLAAPEGWDLIHVSGHGRPGELLLETADGMPDPVGTAELVELLATARGVRLVTLSACWSAALTTAEQRRLLGLPRTGGEPEPVPAPRPVGAMAIELMERLGCAVLAMRYPVMDGYAIGFAEGLYRRLITEGRTLPEALAAARSSPPSDQSGSVHSVLEAATPALFGQAAADMTLTSERRPDSPLSGDPVEGWLIATSEPARALPPPAPEHFVGRVAVMAGANAVLSPRSGMRGVLLYGMPGAGKTACALELASTHDHAFDRVIWFEGPADGGASDPVDVSALSEFALTLERCLPGLRVVHLLEEPDQFGTFLAEICRWWESRRLLIVLDNVDSLFSTAGTWRDDRWRKLIAALSGCTGTGRFVLTARRRPRDLGPLVRTVQVDTLTADEALLLARELPNLRRLLDASTPGMTASAARELAKGLLELAQGHPKLLELADAQARDPRRLAPLMASARRAWNETGGLPQGFFTTGQAKASGADHVRVLETWVAELAAGLDPRDRDLFWFLCRLEGEDRTRSIVEAVWPDLQRHLGHPAGSWDVALKNLADSGLITIRIAAGAMSETYELHPAVAAEGRSGAPAAFREAVDTRLAGYWVTVFRTAWAREGTGGERAELAGPLLALAGLSAAPYLIRMRQWRSAEALLEAVLRRDDSRTTAGRVLPILRRLSAALATSDAGAEAPRDLLTEVLMVTDPATAERQFRARLATARREGDDVAASEALSRLVEICARTGRLSEALELSDAQRGHVERAGRGAWARLAGDVQRLHIQVNRGQVDSAVAEAVRLRERIGALPRETAGADGVIWWELWEELLDTGQRAAVQAGRWEEALTFNSDTCASKHARGAAAIDLAMARFPAYMPLLHLGRADEALALLEACRKVCEEHRDTVGLGEVFGALANVEDARGHGEAAIALGSDSLRYAYRGGVPDLIAVSHANLGTYLLSHARDPAGAVAHHLAAALLGTITGGRTANAVLAVANDLREFGDAASPATDVDALCRQVAETPGAALDRLLARLGIPPDRARRTLEDLADQALRQAGERSGASLAKAVWCTIWEPVIAALVAADRGNTAAGVKLRQRLDQLERLAPQFTALSVTLRRIHNGDRGPNLLTALDEHDTVVATRALDALANRTAVPAELWPVMHLGLMLGNVVAAAGDATAKAVTAENFDDLRANPGLAPLIPVLEAILAGARDPGLAAELRNPTQRAIAATVLRHIDLADTPGQ